MRDPKPFDTAFLDALHADPPSVQPSLLPDELRASYERLLAAAREAAAVSVSDDALARVEKRLESAEPAGSFGVVARRYWWVGVAAVLVISVLWIWGGRGRRDPTRLKTEHAAGPVDRPRSGLAIEKMHDRAAAAVAKTAAKSIAVLRLFSKNSILVFEGDFDQPQALLARSRVPHTVIGAGVARLLAELRGVRKAPKKARVMSARGEVVVLSAGAMDGVGDGAQFGWDGGAVLGEVVHVGTTTSRGRLRAKTPHEVRELAPGAEVVFHTAGKSVREQLRAAKIVVIGSTRLPRFMSDWPLRIKDGYEIDSSEGEFRRMVLALEVWMKRGGLLVTTGGAFRIAPGYDGHTISWKREQGDKVSFRVKVGARARFARRTRDGAEIWLAETSRVVSIDMGKGRVELDVPGVGAVAQSYRRGRGIGLHYCGNLYQKAGNEVGCELLHRVLIEFIASSRRK